MTREEITRIMKEQGHTPYFLTQNRHSAGAEMPVVTYACVVLPGGKRRIFGRLDVVTQMTEQEMARLLHEKFAGMEA